MDSSLTTPFRLHYEHCRGLELEGQVQECTDHLQHPAVLLMEFFESYHQIERDWVPEQELWPPKDDELVLEPFHESLEISIEGGDCEAERVVCLSGSMSPIPDEMHPAISHRGLDYVALSPGPPPRLVLGVVQATKGETPYLLLLRALNCFAELSPPLRVTQLGRELPCGALPEDFQFGLHLCITERQFTAEWQALVEFSRDMAELFARQVAEYPQFEGTLGRIDCLEMAPADLGPVVTMRPIWLV